MLPALVMVLLVWILMVVLPDVKADRKFAFAVALPPSWVSVEEGTEPVTVSAIVPVDARTSTFAMKAVSLLPVSTSTVAEGAPLKTALLPPVEETVVVALKRIVTTAALVPNTKQSPEVVIEAVVVVIVLLPESGPNMETPYPLGEVKLDETRVSPVFEAAPA